MLWSRVRPLALVASFAAVLAAPACVEISAGDIRRHVERDERRFAVSGKPSLALSTFDGSIEIRPWDRSEVLVVVEKHAASRQAAEDIDVVVEQDGNRISVSARARPHAGIVWFGSRRARLIVSVPATSDVQAKSGDGSVDIEGVSGRFELRSGDGSIRGRRLSGDVNVHTGDGSIRLDEVDGKLDAHTGDGSIVVAGALSAVQVRTGDGSVVLRASPGSAAIEAWSISTGDGSVTMELPEPFDAELDAHTGDGAISMHDVTVSNITGRIAKNTIRGQIGSGGRPLRIRTGDGSITLRRQ
jgi:hypothetical protein